MKKVSVTINFDEEKLSALKMYLAQKNTTVEDELEKSLDSLFNKTVPVGVREFLSLKSGTATPPKVRKPKVNTSSAVGVPEPADEQV